MAIDPVCKMEVDPARAAASYEYQGKTYYFEQLAAGTSLSLILNGI